jgi:hypothetical protein
VELQARGYEVASDTVGLRNDLYVVGPDGLARALFEFMPSARSAVGIMYQGAWLAGMPPRFAVMPSSAADDAALELLGQMRVIPVLFDQGPGGLAFRDLDELLDRHVGG